MKIDAATKTVEKAEARERAKAKKAIEKWLPLRRAQLALSGAVNTGPSCADDDADIAFQLIEEWSGRAEPEVDVVEEKPVAPS